MRSCKAKTTLVVRLDAVFARTKACPIPTGDEAGQPVKTWTVSNIPKTSGASNRARTTPNAKLTDRVARLAGKYQAAPRRIAALGHALHCVSAWADGSGPIEPAGRRPRRAA